jgi:hypothetical protein
MLRPAALAVLIALTGCGSSEPGPGGVTANEAAALDDAAEMVEGQRLADDALKPQAATAAESPQSAK